MTDEPISIIDEYLELIREKLPESIADDVITELETYMLETARDLGDNNEITLESAKKVVAQFGAPGEVADEYRYSMLPETIPEEDIPTEIVRETGKIDMKQQAKEPEKTPPRELGVDPTTDYSTFFFKSFSLIVIWAVIVSIITAVIGPIWLESWQLIFIIIPVFFVTIILLVHTWHLKRKKVILWKRSYPDWSIFQILVTLPENSVPDSGTKLRRLDIVASVVGVLLFIPIILVWNQPWCTLIGIPVVILLISRMRIIVRKLDLENDPYEKSRLEFGINFSLLVLLESSIYWLFNMYLPWNMYIWLVKPLLAIFIPLFGSVLLFQVLTGAQNLWWKTDDQKTQAKSQPVEDIMGGKEAIKNEMARNAVSMLVKMSGGLLIINFIVFYVCLEIAPDYGIVLFDNVIISYFAGVLLVGFLVTLYFLFRDFLIEHRISSSLIGRRSRVEAVCDLALSSVILIALTQSVLTNYSSEIIEVTLYHYLIIFGMTTEIGFLVITFDLISRILFIIGMAIRIPGNILEFKSEYKISAAKRIEESGLIILFSLAFILGRELLKSIFPSYPFIFVANTFIYWAFAIFISFQIASSGIKIKEMKNAPKSSRADNREPNNEFNEHARIAN